MKSVMLLCFILVFIAGCANLPPPDGYEPSTNGTIIVNESSIAPVLEKEIPPIEEKVDKTKAGFIVVSKDNSSVFDPSEKSLYVKTPLINSGEIIARDKSEWNSLYAIVFPKKVGAPSLPDGLMGVGVFSGEKPSEGNDIVIKNVVETNNEIQIFVDEWSPSLQCKVKFIPTHPYIIIQVPYSDKDVKFFYQKIVIPCR